MRSKQLSFLPSTSHTRAREHGGSIRAGKRKTARAIDPKCPMHIVLRSSIARGTLSMLHPRNRHHVDKRTHEIAARHGVRIYRFANVGNHLHLLVKTHTRSAFQRFLRELAGVIAALVTGAIKGSPGNFWDGLAYSRIVTWGRDLRNVEQYFIKNIFEAAGLLTRKAKALGLRVIPLLGWGAPERC